MFAGCSRCPCALQKKSKWIYWTWKILRLMLCRCCNVQTDWISLIASGSEYGNVFLKPFVIGVDDRSKLGPCSCLALFSISDLLQGDLWRFGRTVRAQWWMAGVWRSRRRCKENFRILQMISDVQQSLGFASYSRFTGLSFECFLWQSL